MKTVRVTLKTQKDKYISSVFKNFLNKQAKSRKLIKDLQVPYIDIKEFVELAKSNIDLTSGHNNNIENIKIIVIRNCLYYAKNTKRLIGAQCLECACKEYDYYFLSMFPEWCDIDF